MKLHTLLRQPLIGLSLLLSTTPAFAGGNISVDGAFARAVPPGVSNSAAFMTLHNAGGSDRQLITAHSDIAKKVELHNHIMDKGVMRMRQVPHISLPAHGSTQLQPGGYHVMFLGLKHPIKPGDNVSVTLQFADGEQLPVTMKAMKTAPRKSHEHHSH